MIPIDVEKSFGDFIRIFGGEVLEDTYGTSLQIKNADYVFRDPPVIGELKRLVENHNESNRIQEKIQSKVDEWMSDGTTGNFYGHHIIQSNSLPERCQQELIDLYKPNLQKRILKANKQIKETKMLLGLKEAKGVLLVANDGNYALEADAALYLIGRILGTSCHSINSVVYFTANMYTSNPSTTLPALVWANVSRKQVVDPVNDDFLMSLCDGWRKHVSLLRNELISRIDSDFANIGQARYLKQT